MFIDIVGILLTVIVVNARYWYIVLIICLGELLLSVLASIAFTSNITEVIAGGIFTHMAVFEGKMFVPFLAPLFLLLLGVGLQDFKSMRWIDVINPITDYKRPWPILIMKTAAFRIAFIIMLYGNKINF